MMYTSYAYNKQAIFYNDPIDVTNLKRIEISFAMRANHPSLSQALFYGIINPSSHKNTDATLFARTASTSAYGTTEVSRTLSIDVSDLSGNYILKIVNYHAGQVADYTVTTRIFSVIGYYQ